MKSKGKGFQIILNFRREMKDEERNTSSKLPVLLNLESGNRFLGSKLEAILKRC